MHKKKDLLIFDHPLKLYTHLGFPPDCITNEDQFSILNFGDFALPLPYTSPPYRANFYSFVFAKDCNGSWRANDNRFPLEPRTLFFNNPGHIRQFTLEEVKELYMLTLSESFLERQVHASIFEDFPFLLAESVPPRVLSPDQFADFEQHYLQIQKAYHGTSQSRIKLIGYLFVILLIKIKEAFWLDYNPVAEGDTSSKIVNTFKKDLELHYRQLLQEKTDKVYRVRNYASLQGLHPNYLNNVIKTKTGRTVSSWITEKTIAEAKFMLQNSSTPIKQIASRLGFAEPTHFSNYFKKRTNTSPASYRRIVS
jgi:AraC family transcriptional activator of pobA